MPQQKIKFIVNAARWFDKANGNTYHACRITRVADGKTLACPLRYGYGDHYRQTALEALAAAGWLPAKYAAAPHGYERENGYPIHWNVTDGRKRDAVALGS